MKFIAAYLRGEMALSELSGAFGGRGGPLRGRPESRARLTNLTAKASDCDAVSPGTFRWEDMS